MPGAARHNLDLAELTGEAPFFSDRVLTDMDARIASVQAV